MRRNILLVFAVLVSLLLIVNSTKRILSLRGTSQRVDEVQVRLEHLRRENEELKGELEYKKSEDFTESEIRNKLGYAKEGESIVVIPRDQTDLDLSSKTQNPKSNVEKWWDLFFGS